MRTAGVREARQDLTSLLDEVRKGREVVITERGRPVARLVPIKSQTTFPDLKRVRRKSQPIRPALSQAVLDDREDRE
jgi:prevent-host-death family protein